MSSYQNVIIRDLIPFVSQLNETFLHWVSLDDYHRNHFKSIVDNNTNMEIKPIVIAFEQWDSLQNFGAPGVELESVICDNSTLHEVVESSMILNKIIREMVKNAKSTGY